MLCIIYIQNSVTRDKLYNPTVTPILTQVMNSSFIYFVTKLYIIIYIMYHNVLRGGGTSAYYSWSRFCTVNWGSNH